MIRHNLSKMAREIDLLGQAVFKDVGDALAHGIWKEFVQLVEETPQWTGTTAASWDLLMQGRVGPMGGTEVREQPERTRANALSRGHRAAVQVAIGANYDSLLYIAEQYRYAEIVIANHAPGAEQSEYGPLRDVNQPSGALARFEQRVANKSFEIIRNRKI